MAWNPLYEINDPGERARWLSHLAEADYRRESADYQFFLGDEAYRKIAIRRANGSAGLPGSGALRRETK